MRCASWLVAFSIIAGVTNEGTAAPIYYTNAAAFNAATASFTMNSQNFNAGPTGALPLVYGPMTVSQANFSGIVSLGAYNGGSNAVIVSTQTNNSLTFTFSSAINAFGIDLWDLGTVGATNLNLSTANGNSNIFAGFASFSGNQLFAGVTDTTSFTSVTFTNSANGDYIEFDNVRFGTSSAVPEPSTFALFGVFLALGAGCYFYRRQRNFASVV